MNWKTAENTILQFAAELGQEVETMRVAGIGFLVHRFSFIDEAGLTYRLQLGKPHLEYGSSFRVSASGTFNDIYIVAKEPLFRKARLRIHGHISNEANHLLQLLTKRLRHFTIQTDGKTLLFKTKEVGLNIEALRQIRQVIIEIRIK